MKIYLDYVFFINFLYDLILLIYLSLILKRNVKFFKIIIGAISGGILSFIVFLNISNFMFFLLKIVSGIIMLIISFGYKSIKYTLYNTIYLLILSVILGGSLYLFDLSTNYDHTGFIFYTNGKSINIIILIIISIISLYIYKKTALSYKLDFYNIYKIKVFLNNKTYLLNGMLDTGNTLKDPYFNRPVFIINKDLGFKGNFILVPFNTINETSIIKCFKINKIYIENIGYFYNVYFGVTNKKLNLNGVDVILNSCILEDK